MPGRCRARAGLATGERPRGWQRHEDAQQRPHRDGGGTPRAPPVVLCPHCPLVPVVSSYWHGQASRVAGVVRHAWTYRCAHTSQHVCDGVRVLRTLLACGEAHAGKSGTLLHVVTHAAPLSLGGPTIAHRPVL
jgi:hypothetical protein